MCGNFFFVMDLNCLNRRSAKVAEFPVQMAMGKIVNYTHFSKRIAAQFRHRNSKSTLWVETLRLIASVM